MLTLLNSGQYQGGELLSQVQLYWCLWLLDLPCFCSRLQHPSRTNLVTWYIALLQLVEQNLPMKEAELADRGNIILCSVLKVV